MSDDMMTNNPRQLLNDGQRDAIAWLVRSFRRNGNGPDWEMPGIRAAIVKAEQVADSGVQVAAAALAAAANPAVRTPGFIAQPGKHWPHIGDTRAQPTRLGTDLPCPDHEGQTIPCPVCRRETRACRPGELTGALRAARTDQEGEPPW